jgi:hypothetical protein
MDTALVVLAIVVALVAFDAIGWLPRPGDDKDKDHGRPTDRSHVTTTQKIVVDLTGRDID